jgi:hypothetical protein
MACALQPDGKTGLAGGGSWKELAEGEKIGEGLLAQPFPAFDEFAPEISKMCDRAAERGQAKLQENRKHARRGAALHVSLPAGAIRPPASC